MATSKHKNAISDDAYKVLTMLNGRSGKEIVDIAADIICVSSLYIVDTEGLDRSLEALDDVADGVMRIKDFLRSKYGV